MAILQNFLEIRNFLAIFPIVLEIFSNQKVFFSIFGENFFYFQKKEKNFFETPKNFPIFSFVQSDETWPEFADKTDEILLSFVFAIDKFVLQVGQMVESIYFMFFGGLRGDFVSHNLFCHSGQSYYQNSGRCSARRKTDDVGYHLL